MPYTKTQWVNKQTRLNADNLNHLEGQYDAVKSEPSTLALPPGRRLGVIGDSIIAAGDGAQDRLHQTTIQNIVAVRSRGRFTLTAQRGVAGDTTAKVLARFDDAFPAGSVDTVIIRVGVNDVAQGIAPAVTRANLIELARRTYALGAIPVFDVQTPVDYHTAAQTAAQMRLNRWLLDWCAAAGIRCADSWTAAVDPAGPHWPDATYTLDGLHPTSKGQAVIADAWLAALSDVPRRAPVTAASTGEPINIFGADNPLMLDSSDGASADLWPGPTGAGGSRSLVTRPGVPGRMQRLALTAAPNGSAVRAVRDRAVSAADSIAAGDVIEVSTATHIEATRVRAELIFLQWNGTGHDTVTSLTDVPVEDGVLTVRSVARGDDIAYNVTVGIVAVDDNASGVVDFGAVNVINLTRNGLR